MRFIHAADIHLGSKLAGKFPEGKSKIRKDELLDSFRRLVEYAESEDIKVVVLSGDVFDSDNPKTKDLPYFYAVIDSHPDITFYYLRGNHDKEGVAGEEHPNLKRFGETWTSYDLGENVVLTGIEFTPENSSSLYSTLKLDPDKKNIVILHGQLSSSTGPYEINLGKLRDKNIDYLALGHIHERSTGKIDARGIYAYPGCLEGRGFDELGEKGFYLVDTSLPFGKDALTFVPFARRIIRLLPVDISGLKDAYSIIDHIRKNGGWKKEDLLRIELVGESENLDDSLPHQIEVALSDSAFFVSVKDKSTPKIDITSFLNSPSLRGEFVRKVMASSFDEDTKKRIVIAGLKALNGEEVA